MIINWRTWNFWGVQQKDGNSNNVRLFFIWNPQKVSYFGSPFAIVDAPENRGSTEAGTIGERKEKKEEKKKTRDEEGPTSWFFFRPAGGRKISRGRLYRTGAEKLCLSPESLDRGKTPSRLHGPIGIFCHMPWIRFFSVKFFTVLQTDCNLQVSRTQNIRFLEKKKA